MSKKHGSLYDGAKNILPDAIAQVLASYQDYTRDMPKQEQFSTHHAACKVAIHHLILLLRAADMVEKKTRRTPDRAHLDLMMQKAEAIVADFRREEREKRENKLG